MVKKCVLCSNQFHIEKNITFSLVLSKREGRGKKLLLQAIFFFTAYYVFPTFFVGFLPHIAGNWVLRDHSFHESNIFFRFLLEPISFDSFLQCCKTFSQFYSAGQLRRDASKYALCKWGHFERAKPTLKILLASWFLIYFLKGLYLFIQSKLDL